MYTENSQRTETELDTQIASGYLDTNALTILIQQLRNNLHQTQANIVQTLTTDMNRSELKHYSSG